MIAVVKNCAKQIGTLRRKWSFQLRISSVNVTKSVESPTDLVTYTEEIYKWKLHFLCNENFMVLSNFAWLLYSKYIVRDFDYTKLIKETIRAELSRMQDLFEFCYVLAFKKNVEMIWLFTHKKSKLAKFWVNFSSSFINIWPWMSVSNLS